jgi:hypothetical protein
MDIGLTVVAIGIGTAIALLCVWRRSSVLELQSTDLWLHDLVREPVETRRHQNGDTIGDVQSSPRLYTSAEHRNGRGVQRGRYGIG